jgi:hypothetical protein
MIEQTKERIVKEFINSDIPGIIEAEELVVKLAEMVDEMCEAALKEGYDIGYNDGLRNDIYARCLIARRSNEQNSKS